ncbi:hypothetical protein AVEN_28541-1 [Araneus ventricosus]|uniref:Uncharacterized protein n=1 Tax=Araneus ventricosus TaxID=182803 RepID=A0A4Y2P2R5_ARAVE|nr:hypothetical protein AVEN_28541-1 [Araneus ventricosus]
MLLQSYKVVSHKDVSGDKFGDLAASWHWRQKRPSEGPQTFNLFLLFYGLSKLRHFYVLESLPLLKERYKGKLSNQKGQLDLISKQAVRANKKPLGAVLRSLL